MFPRAITPKQLTETYYFVSFSKKYKKSPEVCNFTKTHKFRCFFPGIHHDSQKRYVFLLLSRSLVHKPHEIGSLKNKLTAKIWWIIASFRFSRSFTVAEGCISIVSLQFYHYLKAMIKRSSKECGAGEVPKLLHDPPTKFMLYLLGRVARSSLSERKLILIFMRPTSRQPSMYHSANADPCQGGLLLRRSWKCIKQQNGTNDQTIRRKYYILYRI